jgi:pimeloyl-ACP methyl ester carboxylesterase
MFAETLPLTWEDHGSGRPYLLLHGGAGPRSIAGLAAALAEKGRVVSPVHPGFDGTIRPSWCIRIADLATAYLALIEKLGLDNLVVIGNSVGGWIAAELALRNSPRVAAMALLNPCGIDTGSPDRTIVDPMKLAPQERAAMAFHDPARYALAPATPEAAAQMAANQQTLRVYAGETFMHDPTLHGRLAGVTLPTAVIWGESDRIVDIDYGRRFADAIPGARFAAVPQAGHFPHIEQPETVLALIATL